MKWAIVFGLVLIAFAKQTSANENIKQYLLENLHNCYEDDEETKEVPVTEADIDQLLLADADPPRNIMCLEYCAFETIHVIEDNAVQKENLGLLLDDFYAGEASEDDIQTIVDAADECFNETKDGDRCEQVRTVYSCLKGTLESLNLAF